MFKKRLFESIAIVSIGIFVLCGISYGLNLSRVKTWTSEVLTADDLNAEFDNILNHEIANADISSTAAIAGSKLNLAVPPAIGGTTPNTGAFTTLSSTGDTTIGNAAADSLLVNANTIEFEGATANAYENVFSMPDPTAADYTFTFPAMSGTVVTSVGTGADIDIGGYELRAQTLESDVATGTAPFTIASTTKSTNLNADLLDGYNSSTTAAATVIYVSDASNHLPVDSFATAIADYGTSASVSTAKELGNVKICMGKLTLGVGASQAITNLPFTSNATYYVSVCFVGNPGSNTNTPYITLDSGAQFTFTDASAAGCTFTWIAIGS